MSALAEEFEDIDLGDVRLNRRWRFTGSSPGECDPVEVVKDLPDEQRVFDAGDDLHGAIDGDIECSHYV